jgi:Dyp-type peroxidase family
MALTEEDLKNLPEDGINTENPGKYQALLEDLQGNILKGHGRNYGVHLFLKFKPNQVDAVKKSIQEFALRYVTSALLQAEEAYNFRLNNTKGSIFANFFLSRKGYEYLNIQPFKIPSDEAFRFGMKNDAVKDFLADPDVKTWDIGFQEEIHGLILMADDDLEELLKEVNLLSQDLLRVAEIVQKEEGFVLKNNSGQVIEHFGFADGISQPLFVKRDIDEAKANQGGFDKWDPRASLDIILTKDPNGHTEDSYGSYLVYRKLEQDVEAFRSAEEFLAGKLGIDKELAGAYMVGRFADGTPVTLSDIPTYAATPTNNFNYDNDPHAFGLDAQPIKCPFHAHIRKTNPRGDTGRVVSSPNFQQSLDIEKGHRIARRAISYGEADRTKAPKTGSGLLFLCFQSDINNQFNFMQASWANQNNFVKVNVGNDPIIGVTSGGEASPDVAGNRQWIKKWGEPEAIAEKDILKDGFKIWVHMKGGEYFFAPSISFLKNLGGD